jgi:hypothetical protein
MSEINAGVDLVETNNYSQHQVNDLSQQTQDKLQQVVVGESTKAHIFSARVRPLVFKMLRTGIVTTIIVMILMASLLALVVGVSWNPAKRVKNVDVVLVNDDEGSYGNVVVESFLHTNAFKFQTKSSHNISNLEDYVYHGNCWYLIHIPYNYSLALNQSIYSGISLHASVVVILDEGRHLNAHNLFRKVLYSLYLQVNTKLALAVLQTPHLNLSVADKTTVVNPFRVTEKDLHPVSRPGIETASSLGYIILFVLSISSVNNILTSWAPLVGNIKQYQYALGRLAHGIFNAFLVSLAMALVLLIYGTHFRYNFMSYWLYNFLVMLAFTACSALMASLIGPLANIPVTFFLVLNTSTATGTYPFILSAGFFRLGYGLPMFHAISGSRTIIYGSHNLFGMNIGVILAYIIVVFSLTLICVILRVQRFIRFYAPKEIFHIIRSIAVSNDAYEEEEKTMEANTTNNKAV